MIKLNQITPNLDYIHKYPTEDELKEFNKKLGNYLKETQKNNKRGKFGRKIKRFL